MDWFIFWLAMLTVAIMSFYLGYTASENVGRKASKDLRDRLVWERKSHHELSAWIADNWPNEYHAYQLGHADGYQQGILQSPELDDDETSA